MIKSGTKLVESTPIYDSMPNRTKVERAMQRPKWEFKEANRKALVRIRNLQRKASNGRDN